MRSQLSAPRRQVLGKAPSGRIDDAPWGPSTQGALLLVGAFLAVATFVGVISMADLPFHPSRDAELRATYDTYRETGVPLIKHHGTGSWLGAVEGRGLTRAAGDDDPGTYLIAELMSHITGSDSPYPGLRWVMALVCALPLLILPVTIARIFRRASAGFAMVLLPPVMWLVNHGTFLIGTEYGLRDHVSPTAVYALYGLTASTVFLSLVLIAYLSTKRLSLQLLLISTLSIIVLAAGTNLLRSWSGLGSAVAVGVLWWQWAGRRRLLVAMAGAVIAVLLSTALSGIVMDRVDEARVRVISPEASELTRTHGTWHNIYLGLSYPQPINGQPSEFGIVWSDEFGYAKGQEVDPRVRPSSAEYNAIMKDLYLDELRKRPIAAARTYLSKGLFTLQYFAAMVVLNALGMWLALGKHARSRRPALTAVAIALPTLVWGLVPPVLVMPMIYYYSELVAGLALLTAVSVGAIAVSLGQRNTVRSRNGVNDQSADDLL